MVKQFIADLHSGKLHREFHHGPDSGQAQIDQKVCMIVNIAKCNQISLDCFR